MGKKLFDYNLRRKIPKVETILDSDVYMYKEDREPEENEEGKLQVNYLRLPQAEYSKPALAACIIGLIFSIVSLYITYYSEGKPPKIASVLVFCSLIWAVAGVGFGIAGLTEKNKSYLSSWISISLGALILMAWIIVMIIGN